MSAILGVTSPTNSYARLKLLVSQELEFLGSQDRGQDGHGACTSGTALELGFQCLKEKQIEAITSYVEEKDTFVSLPTGFGKSLIYGVLPSIFNKLKGEHLRQFILVLYINN